MAKDEEAVALTQMHFLRNKWRLNLEAVQWDDKKSTGEKRWVKKVGWQMNKRGSIVGGTIASSFTHHTCQR